MLHHLALHAGDHRNMIILTGHQAGGTRGARIAAGEKTIRILGREVQIRGPLPPGQRASAAIGTGNLTAEQLKYLKARVDAAQLAP